MLRLSLAWRVTLVLILALIALQIVSSASFFLQRDASTEAGFRAPLPDQVAAAATLLDRADAAEQQLLLRALNGPSLSARVLNEPPQEDVSGRRLPWLEAAIRRNLPAGDARTVVAVGEEPAPDGRRLRRWLRALFVRDPVQIFVGLSGGRSLSVQPANGLTIRLFGLPTGFLASLLGFLIAILAGLAILRETRPIARLADAVERFGLGLEAKPLRETGSPETRSLVRAFNAMQARIARLVQGRTFVVAAIAHDLRTQLTRLRLRVALIADDRIRERAERDVEDMQAMVEEALAYAKATRGSEDHKLLDLGLLVEEVCQSRIDAGARVSFSLPPREVPINGSRLSLGRALGNLIDNAVVYGGSAEVSVTAESGRATVWIADCGPGIPPTERERILEPFERLEGSRGRGTGGSGLGLAIVREIADTHSGRILIRDRPGGGALFGFELPIAAPPRGAGS